MVMLQNGIHPDIVEQFTLGLSLCTLADLAYPLLLQYMAIIRRLPGNADVSMRAHVSIILMCGVD
jgi:hypothetical protein